MEAKNSSVSIKKRMKIICIAVAVLLTALSFRLIFIQLIASGDMTKRASEQWYRDLPLSAPRGKMVSCDNNIIADSQNVYTIYCRPNAVKDIDKTASLLGIVLGKDTDKIKKKIQESKVSEITIARGVSEDKILAIRQNYQSGIYISADSKRVYPYGDYLSQVIGFTNIDNVGQNGLEGYYNTYIKGVDGLSYTSADMRGEEINSPAPHYVPPIKGCDLHLTIDSHIQSFAEDAVKSAALEWGAKNVGMIVIDCNSGALRAVASAPSFDLNNPPRNDIDLLNNLSKSKQIVDVYEPGSTFKIFTLASSLEEGATTLENRFYCGGYKVVDGQRIKCWRSIGHGSQTLSEGVNNSCNCVFMDLAGKIGVKTFYKYLKNFGFGSKTNVDFFGESSGLLMKESSVKNVDLARIGFGQAVAVTPLQMVTAVSCVVNGGNKISPYFVENITSPTDKIVYSKNGKTERVLSEKTSQTVRELLTSVVDIGSGKKAQVKGYKVGGKTGTAQKYENGHIAVGKYVSSFVGFFPANKPQYVALLTIDEPSSYQYYGSILAAPYVGKVFEKIIGYKQIPPTEGIADDKFTAMPNVYGMTMVEAIALLKDYGFVVETDGEGDRVVSTVPAPEEVVKCGDVTLIRSN